MTKRVVLTVAVLAVVARGPAAFACSCVAAPTRAHYQASSLVFVGTAVNVHSDQGAYVAADFAVDALYKGDAGAHLTVRTPSSEAACGIAFLPGQRYTVFARGAPGKTPNASLCDGTSQDTKLLSSAGYVRPATRFDATAPVAETGDGGSAARTFAIVAASLLLAGAA